MFRGTEKTICTRCNRLVPGIEICVLCGTCLVRTIVPEPVVVPEFPEISVSGSSITASWQRSYSMEPEPDVVAA